MTDLLDFRTVCKAIHARLGDERQPAWDSMMWHHDTDLFDDLLLDSFDMLRLGILLEELAGFYLFELDGIERPRTVGDVYAGYQILCQLKESQDGLR